MDLTRRTAPTGSTDSSSSTRLRVMVVGGGGRDHALCHAFAGSPRCGELHAVPGNAGIASIATVHPDIAIDDLDAIVARAVELRIDFAVVGAEDLLVAGLASMLERAGVACLGPSKEAARLEGSKTFSKSLMDELGIPTAPWASCEDVGSARTAVERFGGAAAVKADGLAAGCGAFVCHTRAEADEAIDALLVDGVFGTARDRVIVEQLIDGREVSVMALVDGATVLPLPAARDYKRLASGDRGPNTGGMGAHAPSHDLGAEESAELAREVIQPVVSELARRGTPFRGVIYAGVMLTADGPRVLEYNCRFGNPETQALVRVLDADLLELLHLAALGQLEPGMRVGARGAAVAVCVAAEHYPTLQAEPEPVLVAGLDAARSVPGVELFLGLCDPAGEAGATDSVRALGGRAVTVSAWAETMEEAIEHAYAAAAMVELEGSHHRSDVGQPALMVSR